jgi:RNA polymerase primary sigma factor
MQLTSETLYFRDINRYRVLTDEQERELVKRVQRKERGAYNALINANLRFVVSVARRYRGRGLSYMDLINEGNLGLLKAATRFNLENKVKFISYAVWWIRQSIQKSFFEQAGTVRIPLNKVALLRDFKKAMSGNKGDYYETIMMEGFRSQENDIVEIMDKIKSVSLDSPLINSSDSSSGDGTRTLQDVLGEEPNQEGDCEQRELSAALDGILQNVSSREERIIRMYFGLNFSRQFTLEEIGKELNLTRERVRLIRNKALRNLIRNPVSRTKLAPFFQDCLSK